MKKTIHCPSCGAPLDSTSTHCTYCGTQIKKISTSQQQEARVKELRRAVVGRTPTFDEAMELAKLYTNLGQSAHAEEYLRQAIALNPDAPQPRILLCLSLLGFNRPTTSSRMYADEIREHFNWLYQHHPRMREVEWLGYFLTMEYFMEAQDWRRGLETGRLAVEKFPENYLLQFMYGLALVHFGDTDGLDAQDYRQALHHFRLSAELNPEFEPAMKNASALENYLKG